VNARAVPPPVFPQEDPRWRSASLPNAIRASAVNRPTGCDRLSLKSGGDSDDPIDCLKEANASYTSKQLCLFSGETSGVGNSVPSKSMFPCLPSEHSRSRGRQMQEIGGPWIGTAVVGNRLHGYFFDLVKLTADSRSVFVNQTETSCANAMDYTE